jgi:hypothetical protein
VFGRASAASRTFVKIAWSFRRSRGVITILDLSRLASVFLKPVTVCP